MKKSKHFRKDVIIARVIAGVILLVLIVLLVLGISHLTKSSGDDKNSQNSQNTENTEGIVPGGQDTQEQETEDSQLPSESEETDTTYEPDTVYVETTTQVRLRKEPNTSCATLDRINGGTKLEVLETLDGWYKVNYNGQEGYVSASYAEIVEE